MTTYGFRYDATRRQWHVTCEGLTVHSATTLLKCENWVTCGGADQHEANSEKAVG